MVISLKYKEVNWQRLAIILWVLLFLGLFFIPFHAQAAGTYTYRSTVLGTNIENSWGYIYQIINEKNNFNSGEEVYGLTRIFNIQNVDSFQYRTELFHSGRLEKNWQSQVFYPHRYWWAENYAWNNYGRLADGDYELRVYIRVDNGADKQVDIKNFTVGAGGYWGNTFINRPNYYPVDYNYQYSDYYNNINYNSNYYGINYSYSWTHTGPNIQNSYSWHYSVPNPRNNFSVNENVFVLTKISNIRGIDHFRVKHELYLNKDRLYIRVEGPVFYPRFSAWPENYTQADFGAVPTGEHRIKIYISINGGEYKALGTKLIYVGGTRNVYSYYNNYNYKYNYNRDVNREASYRYNWTSVDNSVNYAAQNYNQAPVSSRVFFTDERIKLMTKISNLRYIDKYTIKYNMYRDGASSVYRERTSSEKKLNYDYSDYNYVTTDFGSVNQGSYRVKVYISVNGKSYAYLDTVNFTVRERYNNNQRNSRIIYYSNTNNTNYNSNTNSGYYYDDDLGCFRPNRKRNQ